MALEVMKAPGGVRAGVAHSYKSIERVARSVRCCLASEIPPTQAMPGLGLFESLYKFAIHVDGIQVPFEPAVEALQPGIEGATRYDRLRNRIVIALSEATYELLEQDNRRARFSLAHEIGHGALHYRTLMRVGSMSHQMVALYRGEALPHPKFEDTEWQANAFAAALLMPAAGLAAVEKEHGFLSYFLLTSQFKVSSEAAAYRIESFNNRREQLLNP